MSDVSTRYLIAPEQAVSKFLTDMRLAADRFYRRWRQTLELGISDSALTPPDRRELLAPHPLEDYFYAALIGLQAAAVRDVFTPTTAEALLRQVALQVDQATGRTDRLISNLVFLIFGRIRKRKDAGLRVQAHDMALDVILEQIAIDKISATKHLMRSPAFRQALCVPLAVSIPIWWHQFRELYVVDTTPQSLARRTRFAERESVAARRPASVATWLTTTPPVQ